MRSPGERDKAVEMEGTRWGSASLVDADEDVEVDTDVSSQSNRGTEDGERAVASIGVQLDDARYSAEE